MATWVAMAALIQRAVAEGDRDRDGEDVERNRDSTKVFGDGLSDTMAWDHRKMQMVISNLVFSKVQLFRSLLIGLGAFSLILAVIMILRILFDSRSRAKVEVTMRRRRFGFLESMHPAETFPFVLAIAVAIQQCIFIGVQSTGLDSLIQTNCTVFASVLLPTMFVLGFTMFVFGMETTVRAVRCDCFQPRHRMATPICLGLIALCLFGIWIPSVVWRSPDICFASLLFFDLLYTKVIVSLIPILIFFYMVMALVIGFQLLKNVNVEPNERIAASRMFVYLLISIVIHALILPFWVEVFLTDPEAQYTTSNLGEVTAFGSGILIGFVHMFLRTNSGLLVIKPVETPWQSRRKVRLFGPSDLPLNISAPLNLIENPSLADFIPEKDLQAQFDQYHNKVGKDTEAGIYSPYYKATIETQQTEWPSPRTPRWPLPAERFSAIGSPRQPQSGRKPSKTSYSLFPRREGDGPQAALPASGLGLSTMSPRQGANKTMNSPQSAGKGLIGLAPPKPAFSRHRSQLSTESSATVQIGLRLSMAPAAIGAASNTPSRILSPGAPPDEPLPRLPSNILTEAELSKDRQFTIVDADSDDDSIDSDVESPESPTLSQASFSRMPSHSPSRPDPLQVMRPAPVARIDSDESTASERRLMSPGSISPKDTRSQSTKPSMPSGLRMNPVAGSPPAVPPKPGFF